MCPAPVTAGSTDLVGPWIWGFPATYALHLTEEAMGGEGFDRWVARVTGRPIPRRTFVVLNAAYLAAMAGAVTASRNRPQRGWIVVTLGAITALNGAGHLVGAAATRSYSPGMITGAVLWLPIGAVALVRGRRSLSRRRWWAAVSAGGGILAAVAASAALLAAGPKGPDAANLPPVPDRQAGLLTAFFA